MKMCFLCSRLLLAATSLFLASAAVSSSQHSVSNNWGPFATSNSTFLTISGDASISGNTGALQITPNSANANFTLLHRSGRIVYYKPFRLWNGDPNSSSPNTLASFSSSFTFNIFRPGDASAGEGLAFIIAPDSNIPDASSGPWLGLTNATLDGKPSNQLIAVELDTVKEEFDPDANHLGLDINSVVSNETYSLSKIGIELAPEVPVNYTTWVDYNGSSMLLSIFIAKEGNPKPANPVIKKILNLKKIVNQDSYFGFSASTGNTSQLNSVLFWNLTVEILPAADKDRSAVLLALEISLPIIAVLIVAGTAIAFFIHRCKTTRDEETLTGALKRLPGMPREFRYRDLKKATNKFDERLKLGHGRFGVVYKGALPLENWEVAVKKFSREKMKSMDDFLAELTVIYRLRHKHLVKLEGWCHAKGVLLLVYKYMPNGSLDEHLFSPGPDSILPWERRVNILAGVASALNYLHHEYDSTVVHRDLKASNIMLDSDFNARLGDFGLARALDKDRTSYAELDGVLGTMGYIAPECFHTSKATRETDVYGFGAVVLEVVCGQRPRVDIGSFQYLVDWVWALYGEGKILEAVDERLGGDYAGDDAERLLKLGLACSHPIAAERPKTQAILQIISEAVQPPPVPLTKPAFVWPMEGLASVTIDDGS